MTKRLSILAALFALPVLAGCGSSTSMPATSSAAGGAEEPANFQLVTDLPVPSGANRDNERSVILSYRDRWVGKLVMKLWKNAGEATAFYQQQMPAFGWEPVMSVTSQRSIMTFLRGDRAATLEIEPSALWGSTVTITVGPREGAMGGMGAMGGGTSHESPSAPPAPVERVRSEPLSPRY